MMVRANGCCCPAPDVLVNVSSGQRRTVAVRLTPRSHLAGSYVDVALSPASALPAPRMRNDLRRCMSAGELETAIRALSQLDVEAETQVEAYGVCWRRLPLRHPHPAVSSEPGRYWGRNAQQNGGSTVAMFHATAMTNALGNCTTVPGSRGILVEGFMRSGPGGHRGGYGVFMYQYPLAAAWHVLKNRKDWPSMPQCIIECESTNL